MPGMMGDEHLYLNNLGPTCFKGLEMRQGKSSHHKNDQHGDQLEEGIQGIGNYLCCCQAQSLHQNDALPKPESGPAQTQYSTATLLLHYSTFNLQYMTVT